MGGGQIDRPGSKSRQQQIHRTFSLKEAHNDQMVRRYRLRLFNWNIGSRYDASAVCTVGKHDHADCCRLRAGEDPDQWRLRCKDHYSPHPSRGPQMPSMEWRRLRSVRVNAAGTQSGLIGTSSPLRVTSGGRCSEPTRSCFPQKADMAAAAALFSCARSRTRRAGARLFG